MTLPSRKKHPIIRPNIRRPNSLKAACVSLAGLTLLAGGYAHAAESPLARLRERSAARRWDEAQQRAGQPRAIPESAPQAVARPLPPPVGLADRVQPVSTQATNAEPAAPSAPGPALPIDTPAATEPVYQAEDDAADEAPLGPPPSRPVPREGVDPYMVTRDKPEEMRLRSMSEILPFYDYEPDPEVRRDDPYMNVCPRPEGAPTGEYAPQCPEVLAIPGGDQIFAGRAMPPSVYTWEASNLFYNPLYFEDVQLERYGHTYPYLIQPFDSAALFGLQLVGLPYQMTLDPICKRIYPLGYYRPGECAPKLHYQIPLNARAAVNQAAVTTGLFYIIP